MKYRFDQFALVPDKPIEEIPQTKDPNANDNESVYLKVHLYSTLEVKQTTHLRMPLNITMQEVFDRICSKKKYDPKDYILKMPDTTTDVALEKTLLQMNCMEFCVLKRSGGGL